MGTGPIMAPLDEGCVHDGARRRLQIPKQGQLSEEIPLL